MQFSAPIEAVILAKICGYSFNLVLTHLDITKDDQSKLWKTDGPKEEAFVDIEFDKNYCIESLEFGMPLTSMANNSFC